MDTYDRLLITTLVYMPRETKIISFQSNADVKFILDTNGAKLTCEILHKKDLCKNPIMSTMCCLCAPVFGVITMLAIAPLLIYKKFSKPKITADKHTIYKLEPNNHISSISRSNNDKPLNILIEVSNESNQLVKIIRYLTPT